MGKEHIVAEGEHLARIAADHGFSGIDAILAAPENAELKKLRPNPHILMAGDVVFIPDLSPKEEQAATQKRTTFQLSRGRLELHVKVHDQGFQPIDGNCELLASGILTPMPLKGEIFEGPLDPRAEQGILRFPVSKTEDKRLPITVQLGRLDPIETLSGQQQRLNNLGYFAGFVKTEATDPKKVDPQFLWAVQEFQCDHMGPKEADGVLGKKTLKKLEEVHGC